MDNAFDIAKEAMRLARRKRFHEALALCDKIIANWPHAYVGHYFKGAILQLAGRLDQALGSMTRVTRLHPDEAFPFYMRAGILMQMGRYSDALADLEKAAALDKEEFFGAEIPLLRADCHCRLDQLDEAEALCSGVPDEYVSYAVEGHRRGTKKAVLDEVRRKRGCGCA
jgi:tetratricopeptide (TPR) repeat protein